MSDYVDVDRAPDDDEQLPAEDARASVEAYETEDGVVLYDAENPLAWLKSTLATSVDATR